MASKGIDDDGDMMGRNICVQKIDKTPVFKAETEIVERKGMGHPDSIADGIAEAVSRALCRLYIKKYGEILHHNTDECEVVGGQSAPKFGGGAMLEPAYILVCGRAITSVSGERLPIMSTAIKATNDYLAKTCRNLDVLSHVMLDSKIGQGSQDLTGLYCNKTLPANDTSFGVSFAPFTDVERITLEAERFIYNKLRDQFKEIGEDVKVMSCRRGNRVNVTVAMAFVDRYVKDPSHYISAKREICSKIHDHLCKLTDFELDVCLNTADNEKKGIYYLTVTGLSWENGDDGSVGRGNRANGLITPYRPMSLEATAGKNPVTHVGKLYNLLAIKIANDISKECGTDVYEANVRIVSQIGKCIDQPQIASVELVLAPGANYPKIKKESEAITDEWLANIHKIREMIIKDEISVF
jgi:S-adenosylmethionine synthetase